jgi:hypothetical protein
MPGIVVRRCGKPSVPESAAPIRLTFEPGSVTGGAMPPVDLLSQGYLGGIARVCAPVVSWCRRIAATRERDDENGDYPYQCHLQPLSRSP